MGVHPHPHQPGLILSSWWNVRQKAAVATLCTLWVPHQPPAVTGGWVKQSANGGTAQSTYIYIEYRAVSGVFQNIDPPTLLQPGSVSSPPHQRRGGGVHTRRALRRWGVTIFWKTPDIGLASNSIIPLRGTAWNMFHRYCDIFATRSSKKWAHSVLTVHR